MDPKHDKRTIDDVDESKEKKWRANWKTSSQEKKILEKEWGYSQS